MHFNYFIQLINISTKGELIEGVARIAAAKGIWNYDKVFSEFGFIGIVVVIIIAIIYCIYSSNRKEKGKEEEKEYKRDTSVQRRAAYKLGETQDPRAIEPLIAALKDKEGLVSNYAKNALYSINPNWRDAKTDL